MEKNTAFLVLILLFLFRSEAQNPPSFYPFKGFHVGITAQVEAVAKPSFFALADIDPVPLGRWTAGWEAGIEFSYHFAKYFGVSVGINYGTALSYDCAIYKRIIPGYNDVWGVANDYEPISLPMQVHELMFPVKFEFHYPLPKNFFFTAEAGIKIKEIDDRLSGNKEEFYRVGYTILVYNSTPLVEEPSEIIKYFDYWGARDVSKIRCELFIGMGLYYKLRYGDLLRFTAGVNLSFKNIVEGTYYYYLSNSFGTFAAKNDFIYTQFSYIHTLNFKKAKKYLKKQELMDTKQNN